jgi:hypothetical protein
MGATESKSTSVSEIANEFVSNTVMKATSKNVTTTIGSQSIKVECTDAVANQAAMLCSEEKKAVTLAIMADTSQTLADRIAAAKSYIPDVCDTCKISDITQDLGITITLDDIQNNTVADEIRNQIVADLDKKIKNANVGTVSGKAQVDAINKVKNLTVNNFSSEIVNETLRNFNFDQNIDLKNVKASNISQKMVVKSISSSLVSNALKTDKELSNAIKEVIEADNKAAGIIQGVADTVGDVANNAIDTVGDTTNNAIDTAGKTANNVVDTAGKTTNNAIDTAGKVADKAIDTVGDVAQTWMYIGAAIFIVVFIAVVYFKLYCYIPFLMPFCAAKTVVAGV